MKCREIMEALEIIAPLRYAESWDNAGLLIGDEEKDVKRVMVAVDATDKIVKEACEKKVDMLITHHPLIFSGMKQIREENFIGRRVRELIKADISYCAMHTNFDIAADMAGLAFKQLGITFQKTEVLSVTEEEKGLGKIGEISEKISLKKLAELVKERFELETVLLYGEKEKYIQKIAILPGSGKSEISSAVQKNVDVMITGDIDHHSGIDAVSQGIAVIDAGHYGLEKIFVKFIGNYLREEKKELEILLEKLENPFCSI